MGGTVAAGISGAVFGVKEGYAEPHPYYFDSLVKEVVVPIITSRVIEGVTLGAVIGALVGSLVTVIQKDSAKQECGKRTGVST
jgi:hypothetical protein